MTKSITAPMAEQARIYYVTPAQVGRLSGLNYGHHAQWEKVCEQASEMGFNCLLTGPLWTSANDNPELPDDPDAPDPALDDAHSLLDCLVRLSEICVQHELSLFLDLTLDRAADNGVLANKHPDWYGKPGSSALDPRHAVDRHAVQLHTTDGRAPPGFIDEWAQRLSTWTQAGVSGYRCNTPHCLTAGDWRNLMQKIRTARPDTRFLAWTPGLTPQQLTRLAFAGFDATFSSLPWWDYRAPWLVEEHARLRAIAPVIAMADSPGENRAIDNRLDAQARRQQAVQALWTAAALGDGILMPLGFENEAGQKIIVGANRWLRQQRSTAASLHLLRGAADYTALLRYELRNGSALKTPARLLLVNPDHHRSVKLDWQTLQTRLPDGYAQIRPWGHPALQADRDPMLLRGVPSNVAIPSARHILPEELPSTLPALSCYVVQAVPTAWVIRATPTSEEQRKGAIAALRKPRIAIENITPSIDGGQHPLKRTTGEEVRVEADVFMDGHDKIRAELIWKAIDEEHWHAIPMELIANDRWRASFYPERLGRHEYSIQAWRDAWATYCDELQKKAAAKQDVSLEVEEGRILISAALEHVKSNTAKTETETEEALSSVLEKLGTPQSTKKPSKKVQATAPATAQLHPVPTASQNQIDTLLSDEAAQAMQAADTRRFLTRSQTLYPVTVERQAARFASWYELFPRSHSPVPGQHGTLADAARRFADIRAMGFDVVYFPPIHPIGQRNRKGKNNALTAGPDEPGSPYAIGSSEGGHDALHPELGSLDDFRRVMAVAREHELEIALDFAIQCSPDHPWLKDHPAWFAWRADGTLRYAENPPKRYEDIVNVDFYGPPNSRQTTLWMALRDVVQFWVNQGVHLFRVDNPHTKPLPFWEWLIADIQSRHPDVLFLSEAFTRPKMMYRLAKIGFSQSYTYFTWRDTKTELTEYLTELNQPPAADIFRPHFFVNTPDINPKFLQTSGRPGFLIRAALATTLSGLWGMYNGFELCEARALPGKEEYLDSEKYEIRAWDWDRPGNIIEEISQFNRIRRTNPALQTHLGLRFHTASNDNIIFFSKATPQRDNVVLVAINLDPFSTQTATLELPLWEFELADDGELNAEDLFNGHRFTWHGKYQYVELNPQRPFAVWRVARPA